MSDSAYGKYTEWKGWSESKFGQCDSATALYFSVEMSSAGLWPLHDRNLLELGFGNGGFARWASQQGAKYKGTERLGELVAAGLADGYAVYSDEVELSEVAGPSSLDGVVAFDVFEHLTVEELHELLIRLSSYIKPGGLILGRVPSGDSPFARAIQYGDITHKTILGSSAVRQIAGRCGFDALQIRAPAFPVFGLGFSTMVRRGLVKVFHALVFPILGSIFLGNSEAVLTPNMVFVLRKPV